MFSNIAVQIVVLTGFAIAAWHSGTRQVFNVIAVFTVLTAIAVAAYSGIQNDVIVGIVAAPVFWLLGYLHEKRS